MNEFIEKLIGRLEEEKEYCSYNPKIRDEAINKAIEIVNQLAEEYNNDFCEWKYDGIGYDECPHEETLFRRIHDEKYERIFNYCPYCGKKIKVVE